MKNTAAAGAAAILAATIVAFVLVRCDGNPDAPFLDLSAGSATAEGVITGTLDWGQGGPSPLTLVYAFPSYSHDCTGGPTSIHVTGTYNSWDEGAWLTTPGMEEPFPCLWWQTITLASDDQFAWKFVTNASWDGSYATGGPGVDETLRRGSTQNTNGADLQVPITTAGDYVFLLNASTDPGLFWIATEEEWNVSAVETTGVDSSRFTFSNLPAGVYTLVIRVPGDSETYPDRFQTGIRVSGTQGVDLGVVPVILTGAIRGVIAFDDAPAETPAVDIVVSRSTTGAAVDTISLAAGETSFFVSSLIESDYDLRVHTASYVDTIVTDVAFVLGRDTDLGTITLVRGGAVSGVARFSDDPESPPSITVFYEVPGTLVRLAEATANAADGSFLLDGVPAGLRDIGLEARRYRDTTLVDVSIAAGETANVDTVVLTPGCVSTAATIHLLGEFNGWNEALFNSDPGMVQSSGCLWRDTVDIYPAVLPEPEFKFVTDKAYATPPDYGLCDGGAYDALGGPVCSVGPGAPMNLVLTGADTPGRYAFKLDEDSLVYRATLAEEFTGSITGTIVYDTGLEPPFPVVTVSATRSSETTLLATAAMDANTGVFAVEGLDAGSYTIAIEGANLRDTTIANITISTGGTFDLGTITVTEVVFQSEFTIIRIVGDFNNWDTTRPSMDQIQPGIWVDTLAVAAKPPDNCHFMKFRTGNDWGSNDYHNCGAQDETCSMPLTGAVCTKTANNDPPALGKIHLDPGTYEFRLDEVNRTYAITLLR